MQYPFHEMVKSQCCVARFHIFFAKIGQIGPISHALRRDIILYRIYSIKHRDIYMYYWRQYGLISSFRLFSA